MKCLVSESEDQIKFWIDLKKRTMLIEIFTAQGVNLKTGMTRLVELMLRIPPELHGVLLDQVRGDAAAAIAEFYLRTDQGAKQPPKPQAPTSDVRINAPAGTNRDLKTARDKAEREKRARDSVNRKKPEAG